MTEKQQRLNRIINEAVGRKGVLERDNRDDNPGATSIAIFDLIIKLAAEVRDAS